jgi:hypothetical protein
MNILHFASASSPKPKLDVVIDLYCVHRKTRPASWLLSSHDHIEGPMRFESFELKVVIGKGKFGLVYTAQHAASEKYVAIKFISKGIIFETKGVQRIQQVWFCFIDLVNFLWVVLSYSLVLSLSRSLALSLCRKWISFRTFITLL